MTVFTRTWNTAYKQTPADTDPASEGANRIRDLKADITERLEVDHSYAGDVDDGAHLRVTLVDPLGAKPTQANDETYIYSKDVSGTAELFFEDEAGNEVQLTTGGVINVPDPSIPSGTVMLFAQVAAPAGWTQDNTWNDRAIRVVDSGGTGADTGGSWTISGITVDGHAITEDEMPAHTHDVTLGTAGGPNNYAAKDFTSPTTTTTTTSTGGDATHTHGLTIGSDWRPAYLDVIACSKDA